MYGLNEKELQEIVIAYGLKGLVFDYYELVEPDITLYFFHNNTGLKYCLTEADYPHYAPYFPCDFLYDHCYGGNVSFIATKQFSYLENTPKKATDYIYDDNHYLTKASSGDICMMYAIDNLKITR